MKITKKVIVFCLLLIGLVIHQVHAIDGTSKNIFGRNTDIDITAETLTDNGGTYNWPTSARRLQIVSSNGHDLGGTYASGAFTVVDYNQMLGAKGSGSITIADWSRLPKSQATGIVTIVDYSDMGGVQASMNITITNGAAIVAGTQFTINGETSKTLMEGGGSNGWDATANENATANGLAAAITTFGNGFTATAASNVVSLKYIANSFSGNGKTVSRTNGNNGNTLSASTLSGGRPYLIVTVNGTALTAGTNFGYANGNVQALTELTSAIDALANVTATASGTSVINITSVINGTAANLITLASNNNNGATVSAATLTGGKANSTVTINGNVFTYGTQFSGSGNNNVAESLKVAATNMANGGNFSESVSGNVVTLTALVNGEAANAITLASNNLNGATISAATFTGGEDLLTISINGKTFVAGTRFTPSTDNATTATAIAAMFNANGGLANDLSASASGRIVTITATSEGTAGNSIALSSNDTDSLTASQATCNGGKADDTGANVITVTGLNGGYLQITEDITMNGTNIALTDNSFIRLNSFVVKEAGTNTSNIGVVSAKQNGNSLMIGKILAGNNRANAAVYTVPVNKVAYVSQYSYGLNKLTSTRTDIELQARPYGGTFTTERIGSRSGTDSYSVLIDPPQRFLQKTDLIIRASTVANNGDVAGGIELIEAND